MRPWLLTMILLLAGSAAESEQIQRPPIEEISLVRIHVKNRELAVAFYQEILGLIRADEACPEGGYICYWVGGQQLIQLDASETRVPSNFVEAIGFLTPDAEMMRKFLDSRGLKTSKVEMENKVLRVKVQDPEGHDIIFEQRTKTAHFLDQNQDRRVSKSLIHAGFIVKNREAEDHFYRDILGFRPYWYGGMKDNETNWVSMQVPDGTDWIEYMLNVSPNADHHTIGVMNHIALGVPDIHKAEKQLVSNGLEIGEQPKLGRDGKWQLNEYDPDDTRVEFMEFTPKEKPCCSEFTAEHPAPR